MGLQCCIVCGCYSYTTSVVTILDKTSNAPITGATVYTEYEVGLLHFSPRTSLARTDRNGQARLRVAKDVFGTIIAAKAFGYCDGSTGVFPTETAASRPAPFWEARRWPYGPVTIHLTPSL